MGQSRTRKRRGSSPPGWHNQAIFQFQSFSFIHKMCQEPLSRKFKLKVNSTGTILSDKTADSGASWDNIYSPFLLMASAASQVITVMHLLNLTGAASPMGPREGPAAPSAGQLHPRRLVGDYYKSEGRRRICFPLLKMFKLHALQMSLPRTGFNSMRLGELALGGFLRGWS